MPLGMTTAVAIAARIGAYNHVRLRPALECDPERPGLIDGVRRSLAVESAILVVVIALIAWLVTAAT